MPEKEKIQANLAHIKQVLQNLCVEQTVNIVAVSKGQSIAKMQAAMECGFFSFGENYLNEALIKIAHLANKQIDWHFIGKIQSNKTKLLAENFNWVQTVTSKKQAQRLNEQRPNTLKPLNVCIQVNIDNDSAKAGLAAQQVQNLANYILTLPHLKLRGLMTITQFTQIQAQQLASFQAMKNLYDDLNQQGFPLDTLSMGMSDDWQIAVAAGSNLIRIGTAIFGERDKRGP